ncbi:hypothetical protein [Streptomyces hydrogenans]|uniref:hypothetical protein n=1 Tax=Streptomyces hydrogenans TaxID=1873719 RepID=UPI0034162DCB
MSVVEEPVALEPKTSAVAHRAPGCEWDPQAALTVYGEDRVLGQTVATGAGGQVAWFVVEHRTLVDENFDILLDDDGAGEVADLVGITANDTDITVTLVHCKYSSEPSPGTRVSDLYEVCGQAARGAKWREYGIDTLLRTLDRRAGKYAARNPGKTPYLIGSIQDAVPHPRTRPPPAPAHQHRHRPTRTVSSSMQQRTAAALPRRRPLLRQSPRRRHIHRPLQPVDQAPIQLVMTRA